MADPGNLSYGLITGRFVQVTGDSSDPDRMPDYSPIADGEILITTVQWFTGEAFPTTLPGTPL